MDKHVNPALAKLMEELTSKGVKHLFPSYVDMHGVSKSKVVPISHLDRMMAGSDRKSVV